MYSKKNHCIHPNKEWKIREKLEYMQHLGVGREKLAPTPNYEMQIRFILRFWVYSKKNRCIHPNKEWKIREKLEYMQHLGVGREKLAPTPNHEIQIHNLVILGV